MPRNVPPRPAHNDLAQYLRDQGVITKLTPRGWIAADKLRFEADPDSLPAFSSEGQALVAHWDSWSTSVLAELEEMTAGYTEAMEALEKTGLTVEDVATDRPHHFLWRYKWDDGAWSELFPTEGEAIKHAILTMRKGGVQ